MIYFVIIFILFILCIRIEFKDTKNIHNVLFFVAVLMLILFAGLRGNIEPDYMNYKDIFRTSSFSTPTATTIEPGYFYFNKIIYELGLQFQWVIFIMAVLSVGIKAYFFKHNSPNFIFSLLLFYCSVYFLYDFIAIRQALALSVFLLALPYLIKRDIVKYFILVILASTIHISATILLPLYFIIHRNISVIILYGIVIVCLFLNLTEIKVSLLSYLSGVLPIPATTLDKMDIYSLEDEFASVSIKQFGFAFLFILFKNKLAEYKMANVYINIFVIGILLATLFNEIPQFAYRTKAYFLWTDVILIVMIVKIIAKKSVMLTVLLYLVIAIIYTFTMNGFIESVSERGNYFFPYKIFMDNIL